MKRYSIDWDTMGYGDWKHCYYVHAFDLVEAVRLFMEVHPEVTHFEIYQNNT